MKTYHTLYLLLLLALFACHEETPAPYPDFSDCNCGISYEPICGADGRTYLNECLLDCIGVDSTAHGNCPEALFDEMDTLTWAIEQICFPIPTPQSPQFIRLLEDGTAIYQLQDSSYVRGTQNLCRCLPPSTLIATSEGEIPIDKLTKEDKVWTLNEKGEKVLKPIVRIQQVPVDADHLMLNIHLADGRKLEVSPLHPDSKGKALSDLKIGDSLDGSTIKQMFWTHYQETETWDLLPEGETGLYYANGILIGSTMKGSDVLLP